MEVGLERELFRHVADFDRAAFYEQAVHDQLTGLYNRQYLADVARRLSTRDDRNSSPTIAALMIDLDRFKAINDTFGHSVGDQVLQHVAKSILDGARLGDVVVRYGGEEFVVLLSGVDLASRRGGSRARPRIGSRTRRRPPESHRQRGRGTTGPRGKFRAIGGTRRQGDVLRESQDEDGTKSASPTDSAAALLPGGQTMTTYQVTSDGNEHELTASWPDLPERANHPVAVFKELKLATVAKNVLNAASRYRWHRWVQLQDQGVFTDERVGPDPTERPATAQLPQAPRGHPVNHHGCQGCRRA